MVTNQDCIRDILLFIESNTTPISPVLQFDTILDNLKYDESTIIHHINLIYQNSLVDDVNYGDDTVLEVMQLSLKGYQYLDEIRDSTKWNKIKSSTSSFLNMSLPIAIEYILGKF
ncbi:TPA: DUF2513 domain-containing protein [Clostridioides difficile]|nr:DUF2513 domain-containing protein [Clostridioides difficile]